MIITIAGICVNIIVSSVCFLLYQIIPSAFVFNVAMCNLVVGLFNLLPIKTFDGGQLTELLLTRRFCTSTVEKLVNIITITTVIPIAFAGAYILLTSKFNYSMLLLAIYWLLLIINKEMR
ncbi:MAG: site-2 protease family protein [Ruminococcus sp.]|nr:site-2 protease family protein [Ruminococcus sp.]